jgi:hypothetical protein
MSKLLRDYRAALFCNSIWATIQDKTYLEEDFSDPTAIIIWIILNQVVKLESYVGSSLK